ncbi:class I SAM-dependent methyltransferase [Ciceribacter azotifigens]|uniref:class I SAM-dependent methyltransferase n=1 Tax=Ciceribacter azotifigens TaxID=2069303 RepID=UPI003A86F0A3
MTTVAPDSATLERDAHPPEPNLEAIKARQQATWAAGDYAVIGTTLQSVGEHLCETVDLRAGEKVLDVAAGNGNASLAAARRWADVTAVDYVGSLLDRARARAAAEGLSIGFKEADAEALPFDDGSFDVVLSTFGVMFTPDQAKAAGELLRVCRSGGRIGLANWTPEGFIGQLFKCIGRHVPPPLNLQSPALWGTPTHLGQLFAGHEVVATPQTFTFRYKSADHWLEIFQRFYGPTNRAFAALAENGKSSLRADILALLNRFNRDGDRSLIVGGEYLAVVVTKR